VLEDRMLHYYEAPHVGQLGTIKLTNAQIARQNGKDTEEEAEFRHAFMILEPKRRDSSSLVRHVLCAESDQERDEWVNALMQHVGTTLPLSAIPSPAQGIAPARTGSRKGKAPLDNSLQAVSYEDTVPADTPVLGTTLTNGESPSSPTRAESLSSASSQYPPISGPVGGGPIQNLAAWGNKSMPSPTTMSREHKKRSMFGFMSRSSEDNATPYKAGRSRSPSKQNGRPTRPVFGLPLQEAAELCAPEGIDICLPAPVYRCIEYLEAKNASSEEGIFRLSGSSTVIKGLKERFNTEGDVKLVEGPYYDVHAVASLLKLYLRELPESLLTRDLHLDFLRVLGMFHIDTTPLPSKC
jgi:RalA-binding protein 1